MEWIKTEALKTKGNTKHGCLCCESSLILPLDTILHQGFGGWSIYKNGELFFVEDHFKEWDDFKKLQYIEEIAEKDPNNNWIAELELPLRDATYQRHEKGKWVLIRKGIGFA
jgi:hypothetical protein